MACNIPIVAANVGSMKELFNNRPEWLYEPGDKNSLAKTLEHRLVSRQTDYKFPPSWLELAEKLEGLMEKLAVENR